MTEVNEFCHRCGGEAERGNPSDSYSVRCPKCGVSRWAEGDGGIVVSVRRGVVGIGIQFIQDVMVVDPGRTES